MHQRRRTGLFLFAVAGASLAVMAACCVMLFTPYDELVHRIVAILGKPAVEALIRTRAMPPQKFSAIQYGCAAMLLLVPAAAYVLFRNRTGVMRSIGLLTRSLEGAAREVRAVFLNNRRAQNGAVLGLLLLMAVKSGYYIFDRALQYDEMWGYNYFTVRPFYITLFAYNNYPLFELSTQLTKWLPFPMQVNLRLPVLIMGLLSCLLLYACIRRWSGSHRVALGSMLLYGCTTVTTFYMLYARGVIFESFFAIAALFSLLHWLKNGSRDALLVFTLSHAAGMYSMPTHIYFWGLLLLLGVAGARRHHRPLPPFLRANGAALLIAAVLYLPVLLGSGFSFVQNALAPRYAYREIMPNIPGFLYYYGGYYTGFWWGIGFIAVVAGVLWWRGQTSRLLLALVWSLCLLPLALYVVQRMVVPFRATGFTGLAVPLLFALVAQQWKAAGTARFVQAAGVAAVAVMLAVAAHRHPEMNWSRTSDKAAIRLADLLMRYHVRKYYDNSLGSGFPYFYPALEYYYTLHGLPLEYYLPVRSSIRFRVFDLSARYDCIIYKLRDSTFRMPAHYKPVFADSQRNYQIVIRQKGFSGLR